MFDKSFPILTKQTSRGGFSFRYDLYGAVIVREDVTIRTYDIAVTQFSGEKAETALLCDVSESYGAAEDALARLCENSVAPCHASELLFEVMP